MQQLLEQCGDLQAWFHVSSLPTKEDVQVLDGFGMFGQSEFLKQRFFFLQIHSDPMLLFCDVLCHGVFAPNHTKSCRPFEELKMRKVGHPVSRPAMWPLRDVAVQPGQIVVKLGECIVTYSEQKEVSDFSSEIGRFHNSTCFFFGSLDTIGV